MTSGEFLTFSSYCLLPEKKELQHIRYEKELFKDYTTDNLIDSFIHSNNISNYYPPLSAEYYERQKGNDQRVNQLSMEYSVSL